MQQEVNDCFFFFSFVPPYLAKVPWCCEPFYLLSQSEVSVINFFLQIMCANIYLCVLTKSKLLFVDYVIFIYLWSKCKIYFCMSEKQDEAPVYFLRGHVRSNF